jgi:hypothetical protein
MGWGPGATFSRPRRKSDAIYKFDGNVVTTVGNSGIAAWVINQTPLWQEGLLSEESSWTYVPGNRVCTVPKNYKTDRTIAIEPDMNIYVQKGIGAMIRQRLRRIGIDLNSQQENQNMAFLGSYFDNLATVDLSMASDTISLEIVRQLIPSDWLQALEQARSPYGRLPSGVWLEYQKFSSMGNGYTFELETLIFWGICSAVIHLLDLKDRRLAVYGDDIVISKEAVPFLLECLEWCGFKANTDKTYSSGPFRESCGKHFFSGNDVTPFYVRRPVAKLTDLFLLHNNLYRWAARNHWNACWSREDMKSLLRWIRSHAPSDWRRPRLPDGYGDGAFIGTFDECIPKKPSGRKKTWDGWEVEVIHESARSYESMALGRFLKSLHFLETRSDVSRRWCPDTIEWTGGLSLNPRAVIRKIIVQQYAGVDPCLTAG